MQADFSGFAMLEEVRAWQARPLPALYPIEYFDALFVKWRRHGRLKHKAGYLALQNGSETGIRPLPDRKTAHDQSVILSEDRVPV